MGQAHQFVLVSGRLLQPMWRLHSSDTCLIGCTALGLALAKHRFGAHAVSLAWNKLVILIICYMNQVGFKLLHCRILETCFVWDRWDRWDPAPHVLRAKHIPNPDEDVACV